MKILNIHQRIIHEPKDSVSELLKTLATANDKVWPIEQWPPMRLKEGLKAGSKGGHGPIRYTVEDYDPGNFVQFIFSRPSGFHGYHRLEINALETGSTQLRHVIDMETKGTAGFSWAFGIRWLHDALIEDAFDKIEYQFSGVNKVTPWNFWVRILRKILAAKPR